MVNPVTSGNGIIPITMAPPEDVAPTIEGYGTSIGVIEMTLPESELPASLFEEGLPEFPITYEFEEYTLVLQGGSLTQIQLSGVTIDWAASDLAESGSFNGQFGVTTFYNLIGKEFSTFQYTYLRFACVLVENGVEKSDSWTVRMKHF